MHARSIRMEMKWVSVFSTTLLLLMASFFIIACDGSSGFGDPDGDDTTDGDTSTDGDFTVCTSDTFCLASQICDEELGWCIPDFDNPCKPGEIAGHNCAKDTDCQVGEICDSSNPLSQNYCTCQGPEPDGDGDGDMTDGDTIDRRDCSLNPCITFEPPILQFGAVQLNDTALRTLNIRNDGGKNLLIISMEFSVNTSEDYSWFAGAPELPIELVPGESAAFDIKLLPSDPGLDVGTIQVVCNDLSVKDGKPTVSLDSEYKGTTEIEVAPQPTGDETCAYNFGPVEVGSSVPLQITVYNHLPPGEDPLGSNKILTVGPIDLDPPAQTNYRLPTNLNQLNYVPPDSSFQFRVFYEPKDRGIHDVDIVIMQDADINPYSQDNPRNPVKVRLCGQGVVPKLTVEPNPINFYDVTIGYSTSIPIKLRNEGGGIIQLCGIEWRAPVPSAFTIVDPAGIGTAQIQPNSSVTFWIEFLPQQNTYYSAVLKICSNDVENPNMIVPVDGRGVESIIEVFPTFMDFGDVLLQNQKCESLQVTNSGSGELKILGMDIEYDNPTPDNPIQTPFTVDTTETPLPAILDAGNPTAIFSVCYRPTYQAQNNPAYEDTGVLHVLTDNPGSPQRDVGLRGKPVWPKCEFSVVNHPEFDAITNPIIDFGQVNLSTTDTQKLRITNEGNWPCEFPEDVDVAFEPNSSTEFSAIPTLLPPIAKGDYIDVVISYSPAFFTGPDTGSFIVRTNDFREDLRTVKVQLQGTGVNPTIFCSPESTQANPFNYGDVLKDACSNPQKFRCTNQDVGLLEISGYELVAVEGTYIVGPWSTPPMGADPWVLRHHQNNQQDILEFDVTFCPSGFYDRVIPAYMKIFSNDVRTPEKYIYFKGKGVDCPDNFYDLDDNPNDCEYYCAPKPGGGPPWELCDTYDNDCDGQTDEDFNLGQPCDGVGACGIGETVCANDTATQCSTEAGGIDDETATELCDNLDNDCDGKTDEDYGVGEPCAGVGECRLGEWQCVSGNPFTRYCDANDNGTPEICDGKDNDCNDVVDDGLFFVVNKGDPPPTCDGCLGLICSGQGDCADVGFFECLNRNAWSEIPDPENWVQCSVDPGGSSSQTRVEICDGKDNDCDGQTDEGYNLGTPCNGEGECGSGVTICDPDFILGTKCSSDIGGPDYNGRNEVCDGKDNDCDGETDEGFGIGEACEGVGECGTGKWECKNDQSGRQCSTDPGGTQAQNLPELCDGKDNDCDADTDEDFNIGDPCIGSGACGIGQIECETLFATICSTDYGGSQYLPQAEKCDGFDNDCDGQTDEDFGVGTPCEGAGVCGQSVKICLSNDESCCAGDFGCGTWAGTEEICDGQDNDCDGQIDEDWNVGSVCVYPFGVCSLQDGEWECDQTDPDRKSRICSTQPGGSEDQSDIEICDGLDNDCDGTKDEGFDTGNDPFNCGLCNRVCIVQTNGIKTGEAVCDEGVCKIASCTPGNADVDGSFETGCECPVDNHELSGQGNSCNSARVIGTGRISDNSGADPVTVTGNIATDVVDGPVDVDWFYFEAVDDSDQDLGGGFRHEDFHVSVIIEPPNQFGFTVYMGSCTGSGDAGGNCENHFGGMVDCGPECSEFKLGADAYYQPGPLESAQPQDHQHCSGHKRCTEANPVDPDPELEDNEMQNYNVCDDFTKKFYIKVYRKENATPTCDNYTLYVSNGKNDDTDECGIAP